jgi:hypothetical protein
MMKFQIGYLLILFTKLNHQIAPNYHCAIKQQFSSVAVPLSLVAPSQ